jgi:hypothetical protein
MPSLGVKGLLFVFHRLRIPIHAGQTPEKCSRLKYVLFAFPAPLPPHEPRLCRAARPASKGRGRRLVRGREGARFARPICYTPVQAGGRVERRRKTRWHPSRFLDEITETVTCQEKNSYGPS